MKKMTWVMTGEQTSGEVTLNPLSQGIACPLHNWRIALRTGGAHAPDAGGHPRISSEG